MTIIIDEKTQHDIDCEKIYRSAKGWRRMAEESGIPFFFRIAAAEFRAMGMWLAAERCEEKARGCNVPKS